MLSPKFFCFALALLSAVRADNETEDISRRDLHSHLLINVAVLDNSTVVVIPPVAPIEAIKAAESRAAANREVELYNNCGYEVQYKYTSGYNPATNSYLPNPAPGPNGYKLKPQERYTATFTSTWSGNVGVCAGESCETGDSCKDGCGVANGGPMTRAEWTFVPDGTDYYDVTVINGVNIPVMMEPLDVKYDTKDPYKCGSPGKVEDVVPGSGCSWDYAQFQKDINYNAVIGGSGKKCAAAGDCSGGEVCGYKFVPGVGMGMYCGNLYGWYSANQVCALDGGNKYFKCQDSAGDATGLKIHELHGCVAPKYLSGYQPASKGKDGEVCGCTNWDDRGVKVLAVPDTEKCKAVNPKWIEQVAPTLDFLKKGCPTTYTYPYDDMTSTFICGGEKKYRITFCPAGKGAGKTASVQSVAPSASSAAPAASSAAPAATSAAPAPATTAPAPAASSAAPAATTAAPAASSAAPAASSGKYVYVGSNPDTASLTQWCNWNCPGFCPTDMCKAA
ncbi:hypothetical protein Poli38472_013460 [Pythium oligandrum]|uniref:Uncharacterized protein n=1 Tax=Pythium oligandrum TaxID=41045 RepID=A0A8K1C7T7_PYTOL|nr:hypothetical protein Poli38472_013460 [Pythium oligandrum]|eukprot:TMW57986.1 hypothetical protein Poli38472_013460 [Pythium oligandrum]